MTKLVTFINQRGDLSAVLASDIVLVTKFDPSVEISYYLQLRDGTKHRFQDDVSRIIAAWESGLEYSRPKPY